MLSSAHNVKEHAPSLAGAHVETGKRVHITGDVADRAASGGCVSRLVRLLIAEDVCSCSLTAGKAGESRWAKVAHRNYIPILLLPAT